MEEVREERLEAVRRLNLEGERGERGQVSRIVEEETRREET